MLFKNLYLLKLNFKNKLVFFPSQKIKVLERKIQDLENIEASNKNHLLDELVKEHLKVENHYHINRKKTLEWRAILRGKLKKEKECCEECGSTQILTLDHIIPQSFLKDLGIDPDFDFNVKNFKLLCQKCNIKKGSHFDFKDPRTEVLLKEYLGKAKWKK